MKKEPLALYLEINNFNLIFFAGTTEDKTNFKTIFKLVVPLIGISDNRVSDFEKNLNTIKENIYIIEQKLNYTFKK